MEDNIHSLETRLLAYAPLAASMPDQYFKPFQELHNEYHEIVSGEKKHHTKENEQAVKTMKKKASKIKPMVIDMNVGKPLDKKKEFTANIKDLI